MSAYAIFTRDKTLNAKELETYFSKVQQTLVGHTFKPLALYGRFEDLEGPPTEGTVILEFPSMDAAKAWYDSPAYREAREYRLRGAVYHAVLAEGL
jgi:uncharacterized protein (DUF1330 family)